MKNNISILILFILLFNSSLKAQSTSHTVSYFLVDAKCYLEIQNAVPLSKLDFYTHSGGGRFLYSHKVNEKGETSLEVTNNEMPAFCSSNISNYGATVKGTGFVTHFNNCEFHFSKFTHTRINDIIQLEWYARVPEDKIVSFDIMESNDGNNFTVIKTINAHNDNIDHFYHFVVANSKKYAEYKINVNSNNQLKYATPIVSLNTNNQFTIYPTIASNEIFVNNSENIKNRKYIIYNQIGQEIATGIINNNKESIHISHFTKGIYYLHIDNEKDVLRFIKE